MTKESIGSSPSSGDVDTDIGSPHTAAASGADITDDATDAKPNDLMAEGHRAHGDSVDAVSNGSPWPAPSMDSRADAGSGDPPKRRRRALRRTRTHRVRTGVALLVTVAVAASGVVLSVKGAHHITTSKGGRTIDSPEPPKLLPSTPAALMVQEADGKAVGAVVISLTAVRPGGFVIPVPLDTADVRADRTGSLADAFAVSPKDGEQAVGALLGVTFSQIDTVDEAHLERLLEPYAPFPIQLTDAVIDPGAPSKSPPLFAPGSLRLTAAQAANFLTVVGRSETEILRRDRVNLLWASIGERAGFVAPIVAGPDTTVAPTTSIVTVVGTDTTARAPAANGPPAPETIDEYLKIALAGSPINVVPLPVEIVVDGSTSGAPSFRRIDGLTRLLAARAMPSSVTPLDTGTKVWLVNPTGEDAGPADLAVRIAFFGDNLIFATDTRDTLPDKTLIEYAGDEFRSKAQSMRDIVLEVGELRQSDDARVEGIDVKVTLGSDYLAMVADRARRAAEATTTTVPPTSSTKPGTRATTTTRRP
ncbi:MAG: hypothetical protein AB7L13_22385 [Acidimicrobiia bacterium]